MHRCLPTTASAETVGNEATLTKQHEVVCRRIQFFEVLVAPAQAGAHGEAFNRRDNLPAPDSSFLRTQESSAERLFTRKPHSDAFCESSQNSRMPSDNAGHQGEKSPPANSPTQNLVI